MQLQTRDVVLLVRVENTHFSSQRHPYDKASAQTVLMRLCKSTEKENDFKLSSSTIDNRRWDFLSIFTRVPLKIKKISLI